jgi:hypothetical protein
VADEVVLHDPGIVDADPIGEFDLFDDAAIMGLRVAQSWQIGWKIEQPKFHRKGLSGSPVDLTLPAIVGASGNIEN